MKFEKKLKELEEIVDKMEKGDLSLDESLQLFERGMGLSKECQEQLTQAQQKVQKLISVSESGEVNSVDFKENEGH